MTQAYAPLSPTGRARLVSLVIGHDWSQRRAAERCQVAPAIAHRWVARHRAGEPLDDRTSRPHRCPHQLSQQRERRIINLRFTHRWGSHRIGYHLGVARSTVGRVPDRYNMPAPVGSQDVATATCITPSTTTRESSTEEILDDERKDTAAGFWTRANDFFASLGVTAEAVITDNGACYRSHALDNALGERIRYRFTWA